MGRLSRNAAWSALQVLVTGVVFFVLYRLVLGSIGPDGLGVFSVVLATTGVGRLTSLGLGGSVVRFVAQDLARGDSGAAAETLNVAALGNGAFMGVITLAMGPIAWWLLPAVIDPPYVEDARSILAPALLSLWLGNQAGVYQSAVEASERFGLRAGVVIATSLGYLALAGVLVQTHGLMGLAVAQCVQSAALLLLLQLAARRLVPGVRWLPRRFDRERFRPLVSYGLSFQVMTAATLLLEPVAKGLIARIGGVELAGWFEMANRMVTQLRQLINAAAQALVPAAARASTQGPEHVERLYRAGAKALWFMVLPALAGTIAATPLIGALWIGERVPVFEHLAWILSAGLYLGLLSSPAWFTNVGAGDLNANTRATMLMLATTVVVSLGLSPLLDGYGVAVGYSLAYVAGGIAILAGTERALGGRLWDAVPADSRGIMLASAAAIGGALLVQYLIGPGLVADAASLACLLVLAPAVWTHPYSRRLLGLTAR